MIKEFKKTVGYICPFCSSITICDVNLFDFSGAEGTSFVCSGGEGCGRQCVKITPKRDKYSISIECPLCDGPHIFNIQKITFWQNKFFVLHCPETGVGILFVGTREKVREDIERQEQMLIEMNDEYSIADELNVIFESVERINNLAKDGNVSCSCGSRAIAIEIDNEKITLLCRECGKTMDIPATHEGLNKLLKASTLVLD